MSASPAPPDPSRVRWIFAAIMLAWFGAFALAPAAFFNVGVNHYGAWFLDAHAILAANDALTAGLDPYVPNPLDPFGRPHVYASAWLHLRDVGLTRAHVVPVGIVLAAAFIVAALSGLKPRTWGEAAWYFFVFGSPPVLLAIDRANNDLVVFLVLLPVVPCLLHPHRLVRLAAVVCLAAATALKFYPAVAAPVLLLAGDTREVRRRALLAGLVLAFVGIGVVRDLGLIAKFLPRADGLTTFGAANLLDAAGLHGAAATAAIGVCVALAAGFVIGSPTFQALTVPPAERATWLRFALGALLLTGCFFAGTNYAYRWIFALWMAPLLWQLPRDPAAPPRLRVLARVTRGLLLLVLWLDPLVSAVLTRLNGRVPRGTISDLADGFLLHEQPVVWLLFLCLLTFCVHFAFEAVRRLLGRAA